MNRRSSEDTRTKILDTSLKIFSRLGYEGTNMRIIAKEAGLSVGALYLYHKSKEELFLTLLRRLFNDFFKELERSIDGINDPCEQIRTFVETYMGLAKQHSEFIHIFSKEKGFTFGMELKKEYFHDLRKFVFSIIQNGIDKKVFTKHDGLEATKIVISILRGYVISIAIDPDNLFNSHACTNLLLNGLIERDLHAVER